MAVTKSKLTLSFAKGKLKLQKVETERLADNTEVDTKTNDTFDMQDPDKARLTKRAMIAEVMRFLNVEESDLN